MSDVQHVRVKRDKLTVFLDCQSTDTIAELKERLAVLLKHSASDMNLLRRSTSLADSATVKSSGIENDEVLFVVYRTPNGGTILCFYTYDADVNCVCRLGARVDPDAADGRRV